MLSKSELKELKSLHQKKYREKLGQFLVEGDRSVREAIRSYPAVECIYHTEEWNGIDIANEKGIPLKLISQKDLERLTELKSPNKAIALLTKTADNSEITEFTGRWNIYLDGVRDPGNLGTILRIADWYGFDQILCSPDTVDEFNQKVIQSSMGAIFRVSLQRQSREALIESSLKGDVPIIVSAMDGQSIHQQSAPPNGILVMGNEGQGVSEVLLKAAREKVSIPGKGQAESLNVAIATGILTDWIVRKTDS